VNLADTKAGQVLALGALAALAAWYLSRKAGQAAAAVGEAIDPTSRENLAYRGVNELGSAITGDSWWSLGGALYDWTHTAPDPKTGREDNIAYAGVNELGRAVTGDPAWTFGGWLYEVTHPGEGQP
jgi:hypothetical protein